MKENIQPLLSQKEAAAYLGTSVSVLNTWRHHNRHDIPFIRFGRNIKYRQSDLDDWLNKNTQNKVSL